MKAVGLTMEITLRHETAHCNAWPNDHRGALPIEDWAPENMDTPTGPPPVTKVAAQFDDFARSAVGKTVREVANNLARSNMTAAGHFPIAAIRVGLTPESLLTRQVLSDPAFAVPLAKAAGIGTDLSDEQWREAYALAFQTSTARQAQPATRNCGGIGIGRPCD
jgi:hypothetical protein